MTRQQLLSVAKPILFNTEMVEAILEGRKTVTRRVVKPHIVDRFLLDEKGNLLGSYAEDMPDAYPTIDDAPYQPGDILYVRETWGIDEQLPYDNYVYRTNYGKTEDDSFPPSMFKWHPSIHMPKEAARIFLRVTDVRCERLQDVTLSQIEKEGLYCDHPYTKDHWAYSGGMFKHWRKLWDSTIKTADLDKYGWDANPWVWVYEFERVMPK